MQRIYISLHFLRKIYFFLDFIDNRNMLIVEKRGGLYEIQN